MHGEQLELPLDIGPGTTPPAVERAILEAAGSSSSPAPTPPDVAERWFADRAADLERLRGDTP